MNGKNYWPVDPLVASFRHGIAPCPPFPRLAPSTTTTPWLFSRTFSLLLHMEGSPPARVRLVRKVADHGQAVEMHTGSIVRVRATPARARAGAVAWTRSRRRDLAPSRSVSDDGDNERDSLLTFRSLCRTGQVPLAAGVVGAAPYPRPLGETWRQYAKFPLLDGAWPYSSRGAFRV